MERVTMENLESFVARYSSDRAGEFNEDTESEAMFVFMSQYGGVYILSTGVGPIWIGVQNASARWTSNGKPFGSILEALKAVLGSALPPQAIEAALFYSDNSVSRLRFIADQIESYKASSTYLLWAER